MTSVYLAIGSNMGDRQANIDRAIRFLKEHEDMEVMETSAIMESEPEGCPPDGRRVAQERYLNGALHVRTDLTPLDLLTQLKMIERRLGRKKGEKNDPRPIDLDILFYDDVVIVEGKTLSIPHPRLEHRLFVLKPLSEIASNVVHPRLKKTVRQLLDQRTHENHTTQRSA